MANRFYLIITQKKLVKQDNGLMTKEKFLENKTADNVVFNPVNNLPALEIEISVKGSGFEPIDPGIYREFEYIEDIEVFRTGLIIRN